jgi:hypothetical protein
LPKGWQSVPLVREVGAKLKIAGKNKAKHPALIGIAPVSRFLREGGAETKLYPGMRFQVDEKKTIVILQNFFELGCNKDPISK